ncbi:MAG: glycosyltransferase family 2 protein [Patescibacteria group bacterium]
MSYDLALVLPVQNQAEIINSVVNKIVKILTKAKINYQLIMAENGSTDNTLSVLKKMAKKNHRIKLITSLPGYGRAVITGLKAADGKYLGYMPSDGQCDATVLTKVFEAARKKSVDLVKVYRTSRESRLRKYISKVFNCLANLFFNLKVKDINASPTVFAAEKLQQLKLKSPDSFLDTELLIKARRFNWKIVRIPMRNFNRSGGKSTVKPAIVFEFVRNIIQWRWHEQL